MYRNCMFCAKPLGANAVVESFPVGRRLAFDAERGRLWVVCRKCERWNLTPIEERWEAVEDCERIFRGTRVRVSTENIGLARHPEGLTLVRIGRPMRPEFAAWRYGDQFGRRRRRAGLYLAGGVALGIVAATSGLTVPVLSGALGGLTSDYLGRYFSRKTFVKLRSGEGEVVELNMRDLYRTRILPGHDGDGFCVEIARSEGSILQRGDEAKRFAGAILSKLNDTGGGRRTVQRAVEGIDSAGHPEAFIAELAQRDLYRNWEDRPGHVHKMPKPTRLALEMALHEEQERRAMEGELWLLERAWEDAEEIAAISDSLLLPEGADDFIREHGGEAARVGDNDAAPPPAPNRAPDR